MRLYHGSNVAVKEPEIIISNRMLDFGAGFYTTSSENQAIRWSKNQTLRRKSGAPAVSIYELDEEKLQELSVLRFDAPDADWLNFVTANRKGIYKGKKYDIVIGPVANDNTMPVINDYMMGNIDEETALILLKPQKLSNQYVFLTKKGLSVLRYLEANHHE
ncbi:MAG: DUF3990 domain-containing protein [Peptococcaceae bacterium]|nr:DUF3990 domain-containing protein [Peptococcaceae bacterium]